MCANGFSLLFLVVFLSQSFQILHADLSWLGHELYYYCVLCMKGHFTTVTFVKYVSRPLDRYFKFN